jgi:hypothetical protein
MFSNCSKDSELDAIIGTYFLVSYEENGEHYEADACEKKSYLVVSENGIGKSYQYFDDGGSNPCTLDDVDNITWEYTNNNYVIIFVYPDGDKDVCTGTLSGKSLKLQQGNYIELYEK